MRFTIIREEFLKGLSIAARAVNISNPISVLRNLKLELNEEGLFIIGSNGDFSIKTQIPYKQNDQEIIRNYKEGSVLVVLKIVDIIREIKSSEISFEVFDDTMATINDSDNEITLQCIKYSEYSDLDLEPGETEITLTSTQFNAIVSQTAFAASTKENRIILTAVNFEASNGLLVATATDAARMAHKEIEIPENINFITNIPAKMLNEVQHMVENVEYIKMSVDATKALFSFGKNVVSTRLIAGDYPNTKNIIPHVCNYSLEAKAQELLDAIKLIKLVSSDKDRENIVDLALSEEGVDISAKSSQLGSAVNHLKTFRYSGQQFKISFNCDFVLAAIKALNSEDVILEFIGEMKPFVLKNPTDNSVIQVVTPVRSYY